ncbi:acetylcholine receptor subunit beta-like 1 isoform X7 [Ostrea edulis]|uniref:acetylcholine receptor subunit beta-like 1 isoform X7 n=1 Tax=Ostrea edulis TaxID=37623 RepID=UPI0024AF75F2|nr:acetylcholine receptor subunit beta-like 1 isoform X7 [Ostrea edulis]
MFASQSMVLMGLVWGVVGSPIDPGLGSDDEVNLIKYLFDDKNYNPLIRPVKNINESIEVQFNLALSQLISVDEKNQIMKTNVWLQMYWYDYQLTWNPEKYGGIKTIRINHSKAWRPDIVLFNNADGKYQVSYESNVVMNYDGLTYWIPPAIYRSSCDIDVKYFPFDQQECEMKFGSWTFLKNQLYFTYYLNRRTLDFSDYLRSGTWDIIDSPAWIQEQKDPVSGDIRDMYIVKFVVRRKTLFYIVNLIVPCVLISFASICTFALPGDGGEKITMCISILLALVVFLLLISKILPPALTIPLIAKYLLFNFIMTIIAIGCTVFVLNKNHRTPRTHTMPRWIRVVFLNYLPKALFMTRPEHETRWQDRPLSDATENSRKTTPKQTLQRTPEIERKLLEIKKIHLAQANDHSLTEKNDTITSFDVFGEDFQRASEALKFIRQHTLKHDHYDTIIDDWKYVASVIDRLLLVIFLLVTVGGTLGIFLQAPNIFSVVDQDAIIEKLMSSLN